MEQACIQGEIRCGSAPIPGLAEKKERLRAMLRQCVPLSPAHHQKPLTPLPTRHTTFLSL